MPRQIIFTAEKESFIVRVLLKKLKDASIDGIFVECNSYELSRNLGDSELVILYIEEGTRPPEEALHFLSEHMEDRGGKLVLVGEQADINFVYDNVPGEFIYHTFTRPVDNAEFTKTVCDFFEKVKSGEFKKSILIVDDDAQYLTLVRQWLKKEYKVAMANSGLQAIKYLGKNKVDLILLDHEMPVTSGPQVLEMIRNEESTKDTPVMFLTAKNDKESVMSVMSLKPEKYLLKTMSPDVLLQNIDDYFAGKG